MLIPVGRKKKGGLAASFLLQCMSDLNVDPESDQHAVA